jgi:AraC family transcriptional regulator
MEWVRSLNRAIDYIEDHLLEELTSEEIAAHVYILNFHFQRCFSLLTGMTMGEYIRNRRLSLAGQELVSSDKKVIDVAFKYGYEISTMPANTWAVFKCVGPMPAAMHEVWKRIYSEWLPQAEYERIQDCDFEVYTEGDNQSKDCISEIWMPVKKK